MSKELIEGFIMVAIVLLIAFSFVEFCVECAISKSRETKAINAKLDKILSHIDLVDDDDAEKKNSVEKKT